MADNNEPTLRNALDAVSRSRKWALVGITSLFFVIAIALAVLSMMVVIPSTQQGVAIDAPSDEPGVVINRLMPMKVLWLTLAAQLCFVACGTIAVILHTSRMTRAVLRAIQAVKK
ncbi:MAG TPA: hypothetical protein VFV95_13140 [Vicinamibacterales bacterium]|nr:hypothetical protein [Vicinamibacterales bacterium]